MGTSKMIGNFKNSKILTPSTLPWAKKIGPLT
jgi:hypothetical protein